MLRALPQNEVTWTQLCTAARLFQYFKSVSNNYLLSNLSDSMTGLQLIEYIKTINSTITIEKPTDTSEFSASLTYEPSYD